MWSLFSTERHVDTAVIRGAATSLVILALASPLSVFAAERQDDDASSSWGLGVAVITSQKAYIDIDRDNKVLPILTYENRYIRLSGSELAFNLPSYEFSDSNRLNFSIIAKYEFTGYEQDDADILNGMEDRDGGVWTGFKTEWQNRFADISAEYLTEVAGDSEGSMFNFGIERTWHFEERFVFTPRVVVSWYDDKYVDYYYGVRENEVNISRAYYKGESGVNVEVGARGGYMFKQKHFMFLDVSVTSLASDIEDSPLIDSSTENRIMLGYIYNF